jgi:hypothetical protein
MRYRRSAHLHAPCDHDGQAEKSELALLVALLNRDRYSYQISPGHRSCLHRHPSVLDISCLLAYFSHEFDYALNSSTQ